MADAPRRLGIVRTREDLLRAAAGRADARPEGGEGFPHLRLDDYLARLCSAVLDAADGEDVRTRVAELRREGPFDRLLEALAHALVEDPPGPDAAEPTLDLVRGVLRVRRAAAMDSGPHDPESLQAIMQAPDAFDLLVEIAHDFRSPLTSVLLLSEALRDGQSGEVSDVQRSQLGLIYSATFGLAAMASDVMDLAREDSHLTDEVAEAYAFSEVFRSVVRLVEPIAEEKGLDLRVVVPDRGQARGHPHALSRVLLNLTSNALKFTDTGWVEMGVTRLPHGRLEFYVQDTGRGIPAARLPELFRPFKRRLGQSHEGHYFFSGSGVGLSIARRLVRAMGSELSIESSDERGTRFSFIVSAG